MVFTSSALFNNLFVVYLLVHASRFQIVSYGYSDPSSWDCLRCAHLVFSSWTRSWFSSACRRNGQMFGSMSGLQRFCFADRYFGDLRFFNKISATYCLGFRTCFNFTLLCYPDLVHFTNRIRFNSLAVWTHYGLWTDR